MKPLAAKRLWAPIASPNKGRPWILWRYIGYTKADAKREYLRDVPTALHKELLERVRFSRVTVAEDTP